MGVFKRAHNHSSVGEELHRQIEVSKTCAREVSCLAEAHLDPRTSESKVSALETRRQLVSWRYVPRLATERDVHREPVEMHNYTAIETISLRARSSSRPAMRLALTV